MTKRAQPAAQPKGTNTQVQATPAETGRLALVHFDELFAIWPADPRIPSVESRRAWALARNITPSYVHAWFQRRRPAAKKLKLKIPDETYELPVGTPPVVPIVIKDEPVESEVPAPTNESAPKKTKKKANVKIEADVIVTPMPPTKQPKKKKADIDSASVVADPEPTKKNTKRKREELSSDDLPEPTTQPKNRTKKTTPETPSDNATDQSKPKRSHKKIKTAPIKAEEAATLSAPPKESKKKSKKADNELASYNVAEQPAPMKKNLKRKRNAQIDPTPDDVPEPATQPKKKKKVALESPLVSETTEAEAPTMRSGKKKKTVRFDSPSADMPPSSSPTLRASSPPASDAATVVDETPASSPLSKSARNSAYTQSPRRSAPMAKDLVEDQVSAPSKRSKKENSMPRKSALKTSKAPKKRKTKAAPLPEKEEVLVCDQGNHDAQTGFTCVLCLALVDTEDPDVATDSSPLTAPLEVFDWSFSFSSFPATLDDYSGVSVDLTPLSALPFLKAPAAFLTPPHAEINGFAWDADGFIVIDDQRFTSDGMAVGEHGPGGFFPVLPTGRDEWKVLAREGLLLNSEGEWVSPDCDGSHEDEGILVDVDGLDDSVVLRLPAFNFSDDEDKEDA